MDLDRVYKRTYTSLRIHALRNNGCLSSSDLQSLNLPTTPEVLEDILLLLQSAGKLRAVPQRDGEILYDFLPFLEQSVEESVLDMATRMQLVKIYLSRHMWSPAITELRVTRTHPKFKKESLYLLGTCFEEKNAVEKALENYERVLAADYFYRDTLDRFTHLTERQKQQTDASTSVTTLVTAQEEISRRLGDRYEIVRELGRGGAGIVYQAIDLKLKRDVALKVLYQQATQDSRNTASFLQEARLAAQLDHPHIIDVYDVNIESQYITMEFIDGGTLRDVLNTYKRLPLAQARAIIIQLCRGLQVAHKAGVLHRDIKPANIFITRQKKLKLGDFGIAHIANLDQAAFTQLSAQIGTLPYMAPEQVEGGQLSVASDLYAVGVVFYEMLTGSPPFIVGDIAYHHLYSQPAPPDISPTIDAVLLRCLAKNPADRFHSADELRRTLQALEKDEQARQGKYRDLLKVALLDKDLSEKELLVLKMKRKALNLTDEEAQKIEHDLGIHLPS
ncbi:protein kinase [candidate division KSB3 bacterium]|uniref:non-specific serine/threonine protein kinase n=1 Tax=candidate division KSB3 bacterium TaxID=2044937 RepID=A0A9D5JYX1_9BACT|nr:protein kinase [candidate division KSB3 bacterium]MBD3326822.1 protein kinase [candidate division KSB3 bacterium]